MPFTNEGVGYSSRNGAKIKWVAIHTAEGSRNNASFYNYINGNIKASAHCSIDDTACRNYLPDDVASWTLRNGNSVSVNAELCGFAAWSRAEWLQQHDTMLTLAAGWIADECAEHSIPCVKITAQDVRAGRPGVIGHADYTQGTGDGTHWDPGPHFPWDVVMARAQTEHNNQSPTNETDKPMIIVVAPGKFPAILIGNVFMGLNAEEYASFTAAGVKTVTVRPEVWDGFASTVNRA
jgi:N-acetyl-anhydromuramyl-L-alanine amidase AmpD